MRRRRTIYHNDARHSYLWYFEPPMRLEDAWIPIDEVAGTAVDTFSYCVERGDGAYYPTKVGKLFSVEDRSKHHYEWRAAACMLSLMERGLDPPRLCSLPRIQSIPRRWPSLPAGRSPRPCPWAPHIRPPNTAGGGRSRAHCTCSRLSKESAAVSISSPFGWRSALRSLSRAGRVPTPPQPAR